MTDTLKALDTARKEYEDAISEQTEASSEYADLEQRFKRSAARCHIANGRVDSARAAHKLAVVAARGES